MSWNHRVLAHENNGEIYFQIHEVNYDLDNKPIGYSENPITIGGEEMSSLRWINNQISECLKKPVLWAGDKFPNIAIITYECLSCGRNKFTSKIPHNCGNQFRKRNLQWKMNCI
jgi:hypothetical protein